MGTWGAWKLWPGQWSPRCHPLLVLGKMAGVQPMQHQPHSQLPLPAQQKGLFTLKPNDRT